MIQRSLVAHAGADAAALDRRPPRRPGGRARDLRRSRPHRATRSSSPRRRGARTSSACPSSRGSSRSAPAHAVPISLIHAARGLADDPRARLRARPGSPGAHQGRVPPPARALVRGARRAAKHRQPARRDHRCDPRAAARPLETGGMIEGLLRRGQTPSRPGPGPMPEPLLRALDLTIARRVEGLLPGDFRSSLLGPRNRARADPPVRAGRGRRPPDRLERDRADRDSPRPDPSRRAGARHLARARHLAVDDVRHGRAPEGRRRRGRGARDRLRGDPARQPPRSRHVRRRATAQALPPRQGRAGLLGLLLGLRKEEADERQRRRADGATSVGDALLRVGNLARQRSYVVVVSDFRGPARLAPAAAHRSAAATTSWRSRSATPASRSCRSSGMLSLVDPETGRQLRVDTSSERLRSQFAAAAATERREVADELASAGARHVVLSTQGDWLRELTGVPPSRGSAMSFASPLALLALLLVPAAAAGYVWFQRRRVRESAQLRRARAAAEHRRPRPRLATASPRGDPPARRRRASWSASRDRTPPSRCARRRRRRSSRSTPRARWARPTSRRRGSPPPRRRRGASSPTCPEKYRVSVVAFSSTAQVVAPPTQDREVVESALDALRVGEATALGDARRDRGRCRQRRSDAAGRASRPPAQTPAAGRRSSSSRTARSTAGASSWTTPSAGRATAKVPVFTALLGTEAGVVAGAARRRLRRADPGAARPRRAAQGRDADGRQLLRGARPRTTSASSTTTSKSRLGTTQKDEEITFAFAAGRDRAAPPRRRRLSVALVQEGPVIRVAVTVVAVAAALAVGVAPGSAADECNGLMVCIPVAGPVGRDSRASTAPPPRATGSSSARRASSGASMRAPASKAVAVEFPGRIGSPVNPGITTAESLVFRGTYVGRARSRDELPAVHRLHPRRRRRQRTPTAHSRAQDRQAGRADHHAHRDGAGHAGRRWRARRFAAARASASCARATASGSTRAARPRPPQLAAVQRRAGRPRRRDPRQRDAVEASRDGVRAAVQLQAECAR